MHRHLRAALLGSIHFGSAAWLLAGGAGAALLAAATQSSSQ